MRVTTTFEVVKRRYSKTGTCPECGKRTVRGRTFEQTLNPFNTVGNRPKTRAEIYTELSAEGKAWEPDFRHEGCK